jgi:hypothetical protein
MMHGRGKSSPVIVAGKPASGSPRVSPSICAINIAIGSPPLPVYSNGDVEQRICHRSRVLIQNVN